MYHIQKEVGRIRDDTHESRHPILTVVVTGTLACAIYPRGDFKEQNLKEIPLETKKYATMVNLLEQIYPGQGFELMTDNTLEDLLELADEYQVEHVFTNCKIYIDKQVEDVSNVPTTDKTLLYLKIVEQYDKYEQLHSLREQLVRRASRRPVSRLQKSRHYSSLPPTVLKDVFLRRLQKLEKRS
ncbi:uncharacterized protein LOC112573936 isoform X2 [Pomacea canaliculata]|uniref:uncharacterized protein LOC112573936 isoform X2 n=1 Tax=Pomacea canaliculata TaxID=400727 RepID=UPI000D73AAE4|nr:uncharacterized protein LOC112573936 isoform X2 [Pomacea canaliculata]